MWPFSLFERKANPASRAILLGLNLSGPVSHQNYAALAAESYLRNPTVYACVSTIASACATVPWVVYEFSPSKGAKRRRMMSAATYRKAMMRAGNTFAFPTLHKSLEQVEVTDHPMLKLLEQPNPEQAQTAYVEQLLSYFLVSGNGYEHFLGPETGPNRGKPREMWSLRPDRTSVIRSTNPAEGIIAGYQYKIGEGKETFDRDAVIHHKFFHPTDDFYGFSPLQAAIRAWQTENLGADWNYALLNNAARPAGAVVAPTTVGDDSYDRLKAELRESYAGAKNAGTPLFLEGGLQWEPMGLTPMEMDFLAGLRDAAIRICRVYHIAPEIIGVPDAKTYNSLAEARKAMWQEAALPLLDRLRDSYNQRVAPHFGERIFVDYDRDQIDAIQEDQGKVWDKLNRTRFLSTNEKRVAAGYETYEDPMADVPESVMNPTPGATGEPGFPAGTVSSLRSVEELVQQALAAGVRLELQPDEVKALAEAFEDKGQKLNARQKALEAVLRKGMSRHFKDQGAELANFLRREIQKIA